MRARLPRGLIWAGVASVAITLGCGDSETSTDNVADSGGSGGTLDGGTAGTAGATTGAAAGTAGMATGGTGLTVVLPTGGAGSQDDPCAGRACGDLCLDGACDEQGNCTPVFAEANAALWRGDGASGAGGETQQSCPDERPEVGTACPDEVRWCLYVPRGCPPDWEPTSVSLCLCGRWIDDRAHCDPL